MSVSEVIARMGGTRPAARLLGIPVSTVNNWKLNGNIPAKHAALIKQKTGIVYTKESKK